MSSSEPRPLPCLKEFKWPGHTDTVCRALWEKEASPFMPWVAFGFDHPHSFEFISTKRLAELNTTAAELETNALAALRERPARWEPVDVDAPGGKTLRILTCSGDFFSAERVLDAAFMQEAQRLLNADGLLVGVPRRGLLMATSANQDQDLITGFGGAVAGQFSREESALISPMLFAMQDGAIVGIFDAVAKLAVPDGEPRGAPGGPDEGEEDGAPFVSAMVSRNKQGSEDVHLLVGGDDPETLAKAIESGFMGLLKEHAARKEFSGHIEIVVLGMTPPSARKHIPKLLGHLKGICNELSRGKESRYRVSLTYQKDSLSTPPARPAAAAPVRPAAATELPSWLNMKNVIVVLLGAAAVFYGLNRSSPLPSYPDALAYGGASLTQATKWERDNTAAAVYVPAGETMPGASLQLGIISSTQYPTAERLLGWIQAQSQASPNTQRIHDTVTGTERCLVGFGRGRPFLALQLCKSGTSLAACVESDRAVAAPTLSACLNTVECFVELCERQWREERASLDRALAGFVTP
jgi:uncharacterized protein YtpQ (UPF0354 family)